MGGFGCEYVSCFCFVSLRFVDGLGVEEGGGKKVDWADWMGVVELSWRMMLRIRGMYLRLLYPQSIRRTNGWWTS